MAAIITPVRLDRIQTALFQVLGEAVAPAEVHWALTEPAFEQLPDAFIALRMIGGPGAWIRKGKRGRVLTPITTVVITVDPIVVGKRVIVRLNDYDYFTDTVAGDTVDTVRDRLRDLVNADTVEAVTAADAGAGAFSLTADYLGAIRSLGLVGALTPGTPTISTDSVLLLEGTRTMLVNVQAYAKGQEPFTGAAAVIAQAEEALMSEDLVQTLTRFGVGVWGKTAPVDLSAIAGAHWETRESMDITLSARSYSVRPVDTIETAIIELNATDVEGTTVASTTITVTSP